MVNYVGTRHDKITVNTDLRVTATSREPRVNAGMSSAVNFAGGGVEISSLYLIQLTPCQQGARFEHRVTVSESEVRGNYFRQVLYD
jgi:hypothetical protein